MAGLCNVNKWLAGDRVSPTPLDPPTQFTLTVVADQLACSTGSSGLPVNIDIPPSSHIRWLHFSFSRSQTELIYLLLYPHSYPLVTLISEFGKWLY